MRSIIFSPWQLPGVITSENVALIPVEQLSVSLVTSPVADIEALYVQLALLKIITSAGLVNEGAIISFTVITCAHVLEFPLPSVALYVLVSVYRFAQV